MTPLFAIEEIKEVWSASLLEYKAHDNPESPIPKLYFTSSPLCTLIGYDNAHPANSAMSPSW